MYWCTVFEQVVSFVLVYRSGRSYLVNSLPSGGTPQPNPWTKPNSGTKEWIEFFRDHRIKHQLELAGDSYCSNLWTNDIAPRLHLLFEDLTGEKEIKPSLLHGDLWSGNIGSADGKPSIFDPAVYWGHHEAEWGVSEGLIFVV